MTKMNCKACNQEIDYVKERQPRAVNFGTDVKHVCEGFGQFKPKKNFTSGKAMPIEAELEFNSKIIGLEERVDKLETALKALVAQVNGQSTVG
jgi:hypothetical protein